MISAIVFGTLFLGGFAWFTMNVLKIRSNILMGQDIDRSDNSKERWKVMTLVALGQKKMFARPIPALLHLGISVPFVITQIELIEIIADGLSG
ncbi:MAG TPA: Fe-S oxidoreductase, partial [Fluviicola sp.]|nr:Fe-S oxidoreductase [Fluviicola sp.]